jgi:tetratricopeptide (TPR) repeat protein
LLNKSVLHLAGEEFSNCLSAAKEAEEIARAIGDNPSVGRALNLSAEVYRRQNNYELADSTLLSAINLLSAVKCREALLAAYLSRGVLLAENLERPEEALEVFDEAIELGTRYGFRKAIVDALIFIYFHFEKIGQLEIALTAVQELIRLATDHNENHLLVRTKLAASELLCRMNKFDDAETYCSENLLLSKKLGEKWMEMQILIVHSMALRNTGKAHDSLRQLQKAQSICHELKKYAELAVCMRMEAQIYFFDTKQFLEAKELFQKALSLADEYGLETESKKIKFLLESVEKYLTST